MSKVRNISGGPLDVPMLGGTIDADAVIDVPDFQPGHSKDNPLPVIWPPDKWEPVAEPKKRAPKGAASDDDGSDA